MSIEKNKDEAKRWLLTAKDDLDTAKLLREHKKFAHSCFHSQQAGEKVVKAVWYFLGEDPWGHSIKKLIEDLKHLDLSINKALLLLIREATILDRFYIPTRYPNGLPDITPDVAYMDEDAATCIAHVEKF